MSIEITQKFDTLEDAQTALKYLDYIGAMIDFKNFLRSSIKYEDKDYDEVSEKFHQILEEYNIEL